MEKKHIHLKEWKLLYLEGVTFLWNAPFHYYMITKHVFFSFHQNDSFHFTTLPNRLIF
ncbi:hypothetical protein Hanom_Chr08g00700821 [Helianthus anomalus]